MKRWAAGMMAFLLCLSGCGKTQPTPIVPEEKQLPGDLIGVNYSTGGGMTYRTEFSIRLTKDEIEHTDFWPADLEKDEMEEKSHVPITNQQWIDVEAVILALYQEGRLEAYQPKPEKEPMDLLVLDGGDYTNLSLVWETEEGPVEIDYYWPSDRRMLTLIALLQELAEPIGREIPRYEPPELCKIYFTRDHRINRKRDYSFQLHWAAYEEVPHWVLIYYLGPGLDGGRVALEQADWDSFSSFAERSQLEYFPEPTKNDKRFTCTLTYTDETYKHIVLNDETEEQLKQFFMDLIQTEN